MGEAALSERRARQRSELRVEDLGLLSYEEAVARQEAYVARRLRGEIPDTLLLLEHPPVFTLGRDGSAEHLLVPHPALRGLGISYVETDRGGDITYHGPGQLVGYPIVDLRVHKQDLHWYVGAVERCLIDALHRFGVEAHTVSGLRGVWIGSEKVAAIGIHVKQWITSHGFALNVGNDLRPFDYIVPCGINGRGVTSLERLLGRPLAMADVKRAVADSFSHTFANAGT